jgi:hypothetical protein
MLVMMAMLIMVKIIVVMHMIVIMTMTMVIVFQMWITRIFAEDQRFDRYRHCLRRHTDTAKIDVIEIPQHHPIDNQYLACDIHLLAQDCAKRLRHVAIEHDEEWSAGGNRLGETRNNSLAEGADALISRRPAPTEGQRNISINVRKIEGGQMFSDCEAESIGVNDVLARIGGLNDLQISAR